MLQNNGSIQAITKQTRKSIFYKFYNKFFYIKTNVSDLLL